MVTSGSKIPWLVAGGLAVLLIAAFVLHWPCPPGEASRDTEPSAQAATARVTGPSAEEAEAAIGRAVGWLAQTRVHPTRGGVPGYRHYVIELRAWHLLWLYAQDPAQRDGYQRALRERLALVTDGSALLAMLRGGRVPDCIADLLMMVMIARDAGVSVTEIEGALPELVRLGLEEPERSVSLQIALAGLLHGVGLEAGPSLATLRPRGMLAAAPREAAMTRLDVYGLTHEIFGLSDYGLQRLALEPRERVYLERALPFWSLFNCVLKDLDVIGELAICHQVAGTTSSYGYGESLRVLLEMQTSSGYFIAAEGDSSSAEYRLAQLHPLMVSLQALLGHAALLRGAGLPGATRS